MQPFPFEKLLSYVGLSYNNTLKKAITHQMHNAENNNSKYVFAGAYAFRGEVAKYVFENIGGTGTQLQHYFGNISGKAHLEKLFTAWQLQRHCYAPEKVLLAQKHIMVEGLCGYFYEKLSEEVLEKFIYKFFIQPNDNYLPNVHKQHNHWLLVKAICVNLGDKPTKKYTALADGHHHFAIMLNNELIASHQSISFEYAKKKAIKNALKHLAILQEKKLANDENFMQAQLIISAQKAAKDEAAKDEKAKLYLAKVELKRQESAQRKAAKEALAIQKDKERKQTKKQLKAKTSRKGQDTIYREYSKEEIAAMTPNKRRNLQDKGIIPKGT
jgi:hypothetical protein